MKLLDLTLDEPAANVALDDALVEAADAQLLAHPGDDGAGVEVLRLWEPQRPIVVIGRSSRVEVEVDIEACRDAGVPIVRRASGGAAIVTAPGCLMYAVVLSYRLRPQLRAIDAAHRFVLERLASAIRDVAPQRAAGDIVLRGTSDLAVRTAAGDERKVSGNSMRCRREAMLYHGTLLYDFPLDLIAQLLRTPPRQPQYRQGRDHRAFVANLPATGVQLRRAATTAFAAEEATDAWPRAEVARLVREKYATDRWTHLL